MMDEQSELAEQVHRDVMSCIGCHDCMLACPLPQASLVNIAELNEAVHLPIIETPHVIDFLAACTQCRQCVPACPADLSRADMVLWNKMKVEDQVPDFELMMQVGEQACHSGLSLDGVSLQLSKLQLFEGVDRADLRRLLLNVTLRRLYAGELRFEEGEYHERLCVILDGALEQSSTGPRGEHVPIVVLGPGSFLGEMAVMADQPEPFRVRATVPSVIVEIPKAACHRLTKKSPAFQSTMDELHRRRALWTYARTASQFGGLPEAAMPQLLEDAEFEFVKSGDPVFVEGGTPKDVYLVRSGFLKVTRRLAHGDVTLVYFREGDLFGGLPMLLGESTHPYSVTAVTRAEVIRINGPRFCQIVGQYEQAHPGFAAHALSAENAARTNMWAAGQSHMPVPAGAGRKKPHTMVRALSWDVLFEQGVVQGREVLVVDQNRCTSCNNCIDACARRHGQSRLQLRGLQVDNLLFPTACRHCEDPVCLMCSVAGIVRKPSGEIAIVEDNCIGCGACAERCPYGNIQLHLVNPPKRSVFAALGDYLWGGTRSVSEGVDDPKVPRIAVKCDLCADHDDYACVTACPVGAAFRIDPKDIVTDGPMGMGRDRTR